MAPSLPLVTALFTAARAHVDESSMLQMPKKNQDVVVDEDECRCPGYFEAECTAEAAQGCVWSSQGSSNGPWCQCLGDAVPVPITPVTLPPLPADVFCCQAMTSQCLSCQAGISEEEYCASSTLFHSTADGCEQPLAGYDFVGFGVCREEDGSTGTYSQAPRTFVSLDECVTSCNDDDGCTAIEYIEKDGDGGFQGNCEMHDQPMPNVALNHRGLCYSKHYVTPPVDPEPAYPIPVGWSLHSENWNCGGTASSNQDHQDSTVTTNQACADVCGAEGHAIAAFWHDDRNICRCYDTCDEGGPTVMPAYPNHVMQREFHLASTDMKCPHQNEDRLFREEELSIAACHLQCQNTEHCAHFSYGEYNGGFVCMGCTTLSNQQVHVGFNTYDMEHSTPPVQMIENWDFEGMTSEGIDVTLGVNKWIHFLNTGNSGLTNTAIKDWQQMGSGAGASGLFSPGGNDIAEGSHVLFLNSGDDNNYVYQNLLQPFTETLNIEAAVGGGNGGSDGGYRMGLYAEDGSLVQEVAAGVNGAPDTSGSQYIVTHMSVSAADHPAVVGQHLQLRLMKNKGAQGHYHYIRFT